MKFQIKPVTKLIRRLATSKMFGNKRRLLSPSIYGADPIYSKKWVLEHPDELHLKLDRHRKGTLGEKNNGKYDIIDMHMNTDGNNIGFDKRKIVAYANEQFAKAPHGQIISMGRASTERPLSYDSYPFMMNYLMKMEREGKGMFIRTPEGFGPTRLNKMAIYNDVASSNDKVAKVNKRYGTQFEPIVNANINGEFTPDQLLMMKRIPSLKLTPLPYWTGQSLEFMKFNHGGNIKSNQNNN